MDKEVVNIKAVRAFMAMLDGDEEEAKRLLLSFPRAHRGRIKYALDDMEMLLTRLGKEQG